MENLPAGTLTPNDTSDWIAAAGNFMKRIRSARPPRQALPKEPVREQAEAPPPPPAQPEPPKPPSWLDKGELPESYGRTKVVAMVVSPYMVHVYWDLSENDRAQTDPASLRFHDAAGGANFDVKVDLPAKNWYVHLWSPEKKYSVELGVEHAGNFAALARSNTVETPRAWPVATVSEQFTRAEPPVESKPVSQPLPPPERKPELERKPFAESKPAPVPLRPPKRDRTISGPPAWLSDVPSRPLPVYLSPEPVPSVSAPQPAPSPVPLVPPILATTPEPAPTEPQPPRGNASEMLRQRLEEFYSFRRWRPRPALPPEASFAEIAAPVFLEAPGEMLPNDLTGQIESQFIPGLSSVLLGLGASKKPAG